MIPVKGRLDCLEQTIQSLRDQTYPKWEAILVHDGASECEQLAVTKIASCDARICHVLRTSGNPGASACRNLGATTARGKYLIFLDSDDLLAPWSLNNRVRLMEENPGLGYAVFASMMFNDRVGDTDSYWNAFTDENDLDRFLRVDATWPTNGPIWQRVTMVPIGGWDESALSWQDWEWHIRALVAGIPYRKIPEVDAYIRMTRPGSISAHSETDRVMLDSRLNTFAKTANLLRRHSLLTPERRGILAGLFYYYARLCRIEGLGWRRVLHVWSGARKVKLISAAQYVAGLACLALERVSVIRRLATFYRWRAFQGSFKVFCSTTRAQATVPVIDGVGTNG